LKASITEHLGWGATVTTTEAAAGSIKAEQRRPHQVGENKKGKKEEGKTERRRDRERKKKTGKGTEKRKKYRRRKRRA